MDRVCVRGQGNLLFTVLSEAHDLRFDQPAIAYSLTAMELEWWLECPECEYRDMVLTPIAPGQQQALAAYRCRGCERWIAMKFSEPILAMLHRDELPQIWYDGRPEQVERLRRRGYG